MFSLHHESDKLKEKANHYVHKIYLTDKIFRSLFPTSLYLPFDPHGMASFMLTQLCLVLLHLHDALLNTKYLCSQIHR